MGRRSEKHNEFGDEVLGFSQFSLEFEEERRKAKLEFEAKIKALDLKRRKQKKQYDLKAEEYKKIYSETIMKFAPEMFSIFGLRLEHDLVAVLADNAKVEMLNKAGDYTALFTTEICILEKLIEFFRNRVDISTEISDFVKEKYLEIEYERNSG